MNNTNGGGVMSGGSGQSSPNRGNKQKRIEKELL
jgi:hypothetical protein